MTDLTPQTILAQLGPRPPLSLERIAELSEGNHSEAIRALIAECLRARVAGERAEELAREICARVCEEWDCGFPDRYRQGDYDADGEVQFALAALRSPEPPEIKP